jgi:hypothetical protein
MTKYIDHSTIYYSGGNSGQKNGGSHGNGGARNSSGGGYRKFAAVATAAVSATAFYADQQNQNKKYVSHLTTSLICLRCIERARENAGHRSQSPDICVVQKTHWLFK